MDQHKKRHLLLRITYLLAILLFCSESFAQPQYGTAVDNACRVFNGTTPYTASGCALCHNTSRLSQRIEPAWTNWFNNNLTAFCGAASTNQAPDSMIISPSVDQTINVGNSVFFQGNGSDPDNNIPLNYSWNFGGAAALSNQQSPGSIIFTVAGIYTVTFTVTDSLGKSDPTPATRFITVVNNTPLCTDLDNDGYSREGGTCGAVDCNDNNPAINPGSAEICSDGIDNNCNNLIDTADPAAANCSLICIDNDRDSFSPQGGICGPIDCNDNNPLVNPGATELCGDGIDNDCDNALDNTDSECSGSDCIGIIVPQQIAITSAVWNAASRTLVIDGKYPKFGEYVLVTSVASNNLLGVTSVNPLGTWNLSVFQPSIIPCRIRASIAGSSVDALVANAPLNCDNNQLPGSNGDSDDDRDNDNDNDNNNDSDDDRNNDNNDNNNGDEDRGNDNNSNNNDNEDRDNDNNNNSDDEDERSSRDNQDDNNNSRESERQDDDENKQQRRESSRGVTIIEGGSPTSQNAAQQKAGLSPMFLVLLFGLLLAGRRTFVNGRNNK